MACRILPIPSSTVSGDEAEAVAEFLAYYAGFGQKNDRPSDNNTRRYTGDR